MEGTAMFLEISDRGRELQVRVQAFMDAYEYPNERKFYQQIEEGDRWEPLPVIEELKEKPGQKDCREGVCDDTGLPAASAAVRTLRLADGPDEVHMETITKLELKKYS
jgi:hypothetical protein